MLDFLNSFLELLIADVTLTRHETGIRVQIRWFSNQIETGELPLPVKNNAPTPAVLVKRIRILSSSRSDREIAEIFNGEGLRTARGNEFNAAHVNAIRKRHAISRRAGAT
jgi:hypothetical protein